MIFARFKTSTRTALIFTLFTSVFLVVFVTVLNLYFFYSWYTDEKNEVIEKTEKIAWQIFKYTNGSGTYTPEELNLFVNKIVEQWGMIETNEGWSFISPKWNKEQSDFFWFYKDGENWRIRYIFPFQEIGIVGFSYDDIAKHIYQQILLLRVSFFLIIIFLIIIAGTSIFFARYSLRPLSKIVRYIRSFRVGAPLPDFPISSPKNDEFMIVARTLSDAFKKIQSQTEVLRQFSTDAAHEFKTPLMIIHSEIDCAIKSGDYKTGMDNIRSQVYFLDTMINTLLTIARIEKEDIKKEQVNVSELVEESLSKTEQLFHEKWLRVIRTIEKDVTLNSNRSMLHIIISNLLGNAFNYTNVWEIDITLTHNGFSVRDTGIGIIKENIEKIWDRLYRVDSSWSVQNGHGLGLFLVKTVVEKLGYAISVESEQGKGSIFAVEFNPKKSDFLLSWENIK